MKRHGVFLALLPLFAASCTNTLEGAGGETQPDSTEPRLEILQPERGTVLAEERVTVRGQVVDDGSGVESVTVAGKSAPLAADGTFEIEVQVDAGLTVLETVARDAKGNESTDRRAVLAGRFSGEGTAIDNAVVARLGQGAFGVLSGMLGHLGRQTDFGALARPLNPVLEEGGSCLGVDVNVESIEKSDIAVAIDPVEGGLAVTVEVADLHVDMDANYDVLCIGGDKDVDILADRAIFQGQIALGLQEDRIGFGVEQLSTRFEGFELDVSSVPDDVIDLFVDDIDEKVADLLTDEIADLIPGLVDPFLGELQAGMWSVGVLGVQAQLELRPTQLEFDAEGGTVALQLSAEFPEIESDYVATPADLPSGSIASMVGGFRVGVSDDVPNQLLSAFWIASALDYSEPVPDDHPAKATFGADVEQIDVHFLLPPMISVDETGGARLLFGDVMVDVMGGGQEVLERFVVSGEVGLGVTITEDFRLSIETSNPDLAVQILESSGQNLLNEEQLAAVSGLAIEEMASRIDESLGALPIPTLADAEVTAPAIRAAPGYVLLGAELTASSP